MKLIIFDLDGVLVDACEWHRVALNEALKEVCNCEITLEDHHKEFNGTPTRAKLQKLVEMGRIDSSDIDKVYKLKQKKTVEVIEAQADKRPEKIKMLKWIRNKDISVACFTNSIRETTTLMLQKTGIIDLFDLITTNQDVKNAKPSPEGYLSTLKSFNVDPHEALIIEDSPKGMEAAIASGCNVVRVKNPDEVNIELIRRHIL
tara:strand:+ start:9982 stop:10590 length:609 start_codon:yes stop_codon:yes gene_type:complete